MKSTWKKIVLLVLLSGIGGGVYVMMQPGKREPVKQSGAFKALNLWGWQRAYPNKTFPQSGYYQAFLYSRRELRGDVDASPNVEPWEPLGPFNIGGRTLAIAFNPQNPNTIYAGSASGGLWRSYSGGVGTDAWEYVPTGFPVLGVSSIAIVPDDSNTIYIGTGEVYNYQNTGTDAAIRITRGSYGIGILKSTDGGVTWTKSLDWSYQQQRGVWAVRINPLNPNTIWAGTTEGVYKSTDAGASWVLVRPQQMVMDLEINPADTNMIFFTSGNLGNQPDQGIYRTTDGGQTWTELASGVPQNFGGKAMITIAPSAPM